MADDPLPVIPAVHFIAFRGDEYLSARRVWGRPTFIHRRWDRRAQRDIHPLDTVVFAKGSELDPFSQWPGDDIIETD